MQPSQDTLNHCAVFERTTRTEIKLFYDGKYFFCAPDSYYAHNKWNRNDDINKFLESLNNFSPVCLTFIFLWPREKRILRNWAIFLYFIGNRKPPGNNRR